MVARDEVLRKRPNRGRLAGKVAIVIGSAEGMGEVTAKLFAQEGTKIIVAGNNFS